MEGKVVSAICMAVFIMMLIWRITLMDFASEIAALRDTFNYRLFEYMAPLVLWFGLHPCLLQRFRVRACENETFLIYAMHSMVLSVFGMFFTHFLTPIVPLSRLAYYILSPIITVVCICLFAGFMQKNTQAIYSILVGKLKLGD